VTEKDTSEFALVTQLCLYSPIIETGDASYFYYVDCNLDAVPSILRGASPNLAHVIRGP
jgi:hypothetical protein